jgi:hypothetical protein
LDRECELIIVDFLNKRHGKAEFPVSTEDLTLLLERDTEDLDQFADLSVYGVDVEGVTEFEVGKKPSVKISNELASDPRRENRLRTTLTHEYGHVHFHAYLWEVESSRPNIWDAADKRGRHNCRRHDMLDSRQTDWMEWQAGYVCGALLMPITYLKRVVGAYQEKHGIYGSVLERGPHGMALVREVMAAFKVSEEAAAIRLKRLGFVGNTEAAPSLFST